MRVNGLNDYSTLFSSINGNSAGAQTGNMFSMSSLISEYNSIRNGSYSKLAKQYYAKVGSDDSSDKVSAKDTLKTTFSDKFDTKSELSIAENKSLISDVSKFRKSVSQLTNDDTLLNKKEVKDANGNTTESYDYEKISGMLKSFADGYNSIIEKGGDSDNSTVLRNTLNMTNTVAKYQKQLESIGISVNSDNTLSFDSEKLQNADMNTVKSLFSPTSSFSRQLDTMATNVASQAASDVFSQGGYTSNGAYKQTLESIYNTTI